MKVYSEKEIEKISKKTEFIVQRKTGGWKGFNIYARHVIFSSFTVEAISDKKPILTKKLKLKIIVLALKNKEIQAHNLPLYYKKEKLWGEWQRDIRYLGDLLFGNPEFFKIIEAALLKECDNVKTNQIFQRFKDLECIKDALNDISKQEKPGIDRVITGKKEERF